MSLQGLESGHRPGSCDLGRCLCYGHGPDAANLPIRDNTMPTFSRRHVVGAALGGSLAAMISGVGPASRSASAQSIMRPDDALKALMDGNRRFVERRLTSFQEDIDMLL